MIAIAGDVGIAVVIPNWNGAAVLPACLGALREQTRVADEVCVVDNGSTDGSAARAALRDESLQVVALPTNRGFGAACNAGIAATTSEWICVLNSDARLESDALERLAHAASRAAPDVGALQPLLLFEDDAGRVNSTGIEVHHDGSAHDRDFGVPLWAAHATGEVFGATCGAALLRREMLLDVACDGAVFDETFFMYFEDVDLAWRARRRGWRAQFLDHVVVHHRFQASSRRQPGAFVETQCRLNRVRCLAKHASGRLLLRAARLTLGDARWLFRHLGGQALRRWLEAAWDGLRGRRQVAERARVGRREVEASWLRNAPRRRGLRRR